MKTYTVTVKEEHLRVLAAALHELPYKLAAPVLEDLQRQVSEQDKKAAALPVKASASRAK